MISDEALDAAVDALVSSRLGDHKGINGEEFVEAARAALEAAAPIMIEHFANRIDWRCTDCEDQIDVSVALKKLRSCNP